jgi:hypothetical protein
VDLRVVKAKPSKGKRPRLRKVVPMWSMSKVERGLALSETQVIETLPIITSTLVAIDPLNEYRPVTSFFLFLPFRHIYN